MTDLNVTTLSGAESVLDETAVAGFRASLRGPLLTPSDDGYDAARQIHNRMHDKHPALIARCTGVADGLAA